MCMTRISIIHHTCTRTHTMSMTVAETGYWYLLGQKYCEKRKVFSLALKDDRVEQCLRPWGSEFQKGSKAREGVKTMSLAFLLLDFQYVGVRRRALCTRWRVDYRKTIYSIETHTSDFILNTFWNGKPVQFFLQERFWVVVVRCQENEPCRKVLNFLERLDDRIRYTHKQTVAVVKSWQQVLAASSVRNLRIELMLLSSK